jgi:hypothetical protein
MRRFKSAARQERRTLSFRHKCFTRARVRHSNDHVALFAMLFVWRLLLRRCDGEGSAHMFFCVSNITIHVPRRTLNSARLV